MIVNLIKLLIGMYLAGFVIRAARRFIATALVKNTSPDEKIKEQSVKTLELMPCPNCGVYTTVPCTNPECMKN